MNTYTLAFDGDLLVSVVPTGRSVQEELDREAQNGAPDMSADDVRLIENVILTDDEPDDADSVVYSGSEYGWLTDENGTSYEYAVQS